MNRRSFLERSATVASAFAAGITLKPARGLLAQIAPAGNPLRFPAAFAGGMLAVEPRQLEIWPGRQTNVFAVNGSVPGPTIRVRKGADFEAHVMNMLSEPLVIHWHGILAPAHLDGHPRDSVAAGQSYMVKFPVNQRAGTYWYHSHTDLLTGKQAYLGVAGAFIVEDPAEAALGLPTGDHDVILIIADKRPDAGGQLPYAPTMMEIATGFLGEAVLVNGTPDAYLPVDQGLYRLRLINASNARVYKLGLSDERPFHLIANDAGLLPKPAQVTSFLLPPGGRAELLMNFTAYSQGTSVKLVSHPYAAPGGGGGHGGGSGGMIMGPVQGMELDVLRFDVDRSAQTVPLVPANLVAFTPHDAMQAKRTRAFTLGVSHLDKHQINGATFDAQRVDLTVPKGDLEIWEFKDTTNEFHPMHPHGAHFQVMERSGTPVIPPEDTGWKDTVLVGANETVKVLIKFESYEGIFVNHCHNLEHEDDGMMQNLEIKSDAVVEPSGPSLAIEHMGNMLHLSWPMSAEGYQLQSRSSLDHMSEWQPVTQVPEMIGDRMVLVIEGNSPAHFYRLARL